MTEPEFEEPGRLIVRAGREVAAMLGDDWEITEPGPYPSGSVVLRSANAAMHVRLSTSTSGKSLEVEPLATYPDGTAERIPGLAFSLRLWDPDRIASAIPARIRPARYHDARERMLERWHTERQHRAATLACAKRLAAVRPLPDGLEIAQPVSGGRDFPVQVYWRNAVLESRNAILYRHPHMAATVEALDDGRLSISVQISAVPEEKIGALLDLIGLPRIDYGEHYGPAEDGVQAF